ncbi:MAG TPA: pentapeptide repeat-containing protein [Alphaproteobacteria bacterium]|nr:pentapeptide repeat-containing protein [Alphaproteobacteria bacterium]
MKRFTPTQLAKILANHSAWLLGQPSGRRADLSHADLSHADLRGADLRGAVLRGADLRDAVLRGADLTGADLSHADLTGADLRDAVLRGADLSYAVLKNTNLNHAVLSRADLRRADLMGADLHENWQAVEAYRDLLWVGPLGSRNDFLFVNLREGRLIAGCWEGTVEAFVAQVVATHGASVYAREYAATVDYLRALVAARREGEGVPESGLGAADLPEARS